MWAVIKSLKACPETNSPNEAMQDHHRKNADIFTSHYASVSRHQFAREEGTRNRGLKKYLDHAHTDSAHSQEFTLTELRNALSKMRREGAFQGDGRLSTDRTAGNLQPIPEEYKDPTNKEKSSYHTTPQVRQTSQQAIILPPHKPDIMRWGNLWRGW